MSLSYDIREVAEQFKAEGDQWSVTETLIFTTMAVGINRITERNVDAFIERVMVLQEVNGPLMTTWDGTSVQPRSITAQEIRDRIGLSTNASAMTAAAFRKQVADLVFKNARSKLRA